MNKQFLKEKVQNYKNSCPMLICGDAMKWFNKAWKYKTVSITTKEELKELAEYYSLVTPSTPLVLYDLAYLPSNSLNILLKLVEDAKFPIILLSSVDNFNNILLSRIKTFVKFYDNELDSKFLPIEDAIDLIESKEDKDQVELDKIKLRRDYCPSLYYLEKTVGKGRNSKKIIEILK